jgi:hypothetical protein
MTIHTPVQQGHMPDQKASLSTTVASRKEPAVPEWLSFPIVESVLITDDSPLFETMKETCRKLDALLAKGTPGERLRAQAILRAYRQAFKLIETARTLYKQPAAR